MEHNATATAPHTAIHPAGVHLSSSRLCHTDGPLLCHEMSSVCACARVPYRIFCVCMCFWCTAVAGEGDDNVWYILAGLHMRVAVGQTSVVSHSSLSKRRSLLLSGCVNHLQKHQYYPCYLLVALQVVVVTSLSSCRQHSREKSGLVFFPSEETAWCYFMLLLLQLLHFLSWIIYNSKFAFDQTSLFLFLFHCRLFSYQKLHIGATVILDWQKRTAEKCSRHTM